ncbi:MAG: hypothetical protein ACJ79S_04785 [Gemmatimonadaceae bacterium]
MAKEKRDDAHGANDPEHYTESAADRAHGTHGKGDVREQRLDEANVQPPNPPTADVGLTSDANWGDAASGGSTIDKRSPKHRDKPDSRPRR